MTQKKVPICNSHNRENMNKTYYAFCAPALVTFPNPQLKKNKICT